ncbi:MAG: thiamine diphosphokinase [Oscillospiraceae bacterium]|nr:thiamine diphosphokinase [Oscillospiraceae bacterium]
MTAVIVGAGDFVSLPTVAYDLIIAADGGYDALRAIGVTPHAVVGDFDSVHVSDFSEQTELFTFSQNKNESDMELAVAEAMRRGADVIDICGGLGGRLDHTVANFALLANVSRTARHCRLIGNHEIVHAVTDGTLTFTPSESCAFVSIFPAGERADGASLRGLKYTLDNETLFNTSTRGLSNEPILGEQIHVSVQSGTLFVIEIL